MTHKETIALINAAYVALSDLGEVTRYRDEIFKMRMRDERVHRGHNRGEYLCTIRDAARMFVVRDLSDWPKANRYTVGDLLGMVPAYQQAAMVAARYNMQLRAALFAFDFEQLRTLDYVKLVSARD